MFDNLFGRSRPGGFLSAGSQPLLEKLEDRDVPAVISGCVYHDANNNGLMDAGEVGIANSTIQLRDANNRVVATTVTDSMGMYSFTRFNGSNPGPGRVSHQVTFDQTRTNVTRFGSLPMFNASLGQLTKVEIIAEGGFQTNVMTENLENATASMKAELNGSIRYNVGGTTIQGTAERVLTTTMSAFDGTPDFQGSSARDFGITQLQGSFQSITLTNQSDLANFIGSGTVNVSQNAEMESCACGTGNLMSMIRTTAQGKVQVVYHYQPGNEIGPGNYKIVQVTQPNGYVDGLDTRGNMTPIPNSYRTDVITVGVVDVNDVIDHNCFGEIRASSIAGKVYHDVNRNGTFNNGDGGIAGVTITLSGTDLFGRSVTRTTTTNAAGDYRFGNLAAGNYTIRETQPTGYLQGTNNLGSRGGSISGDSFRMRLGQAVNAINYNFGEILNTAEPPGGGSSVGKEGKGWFIYTSSGAWGW